MNPSSWRLGSRPYATDAVASELPQRRRLLMIAYHFPPVAGSSGLQRTLRFVQHLPSLGWDPVVLTAHPRAYVSVSEDLMAEIPSTVHVQRAFALDTSRHLSVRGHYPGFAARPDRWVSWWLGAVPVGWRLIRRFRPQVIWSTYPIATAHLIAHTLHGLSGLPWVADFRDPMAQVGYPADPRTWQSFQRIEAHTIRAAAACTFTTPGAMRMYRERYSDVPPEHFQVIENGYDEESFAGLDGRVSSEAPLVPGKLTLLHSGIVYPSERDPSHLIAALARIRDKNPQVAARLMVRFRAPVHDLLLRELAVASGVESLIEIKPAVSYREALKEMLSADGLIVLQAANCSDQVPAKVYEYVRACRPILAFTNEDGDTAGVIAGMGLPVLAPLDDTDRIAAALLRFVHEPQWRSSLIAPSSAVPQASRAARSIELANLLERVTLAGNHALSRLTHNTP